MRSSPRMPIIIAPILRMLLASAAVAGAIASQFPTGLNATVAPATSLAQTTPSPTPSPSPTPTATTPQEQFANTWQTLQLPLIAAGGALSLYLIILWTKPQLLLKLPSTDIAVPWTSWKLPLGMVRWLKYRDRTLDAWVKDHWRTSQQAFLQIKTVDDRQIHIPLPVSLNGKSIPIFSGADLRLTFQKKTVVVLIKGEGGSGKTSLACQIALWGLDKQLGRHRMLPVLVEAELDDQSLLEVVRGKINALTDQSEAIAPDLVEKLLQRQRILVIVDHLSEMSDATRKQIKPELASFVAKTLVVTSRLDESLGDLPKTVLQPQRIEANRLTPFMDDYLKSRDKRQLFEDDEFLTASLRLSRMVGQRNITVLLARLYVEQMIEQREGAGGVLPDNVPELMLSYLNQLNRSIEPKIKRDDLEVQQTAGAIAWECLQQTYRPTAANREDAIARIVAQGVEQSEAIARLKYLEEKLRLVETLAPGHRVRIVLDPLAEYLAADYLVETYRRKDDPVAVWQKFFSSIDEVLAKSNDPPAAIQGFLLAMKDRCELKRNQTHVPEDVPEALIRKAGLDPEELRQAEQKRRISLWCFSLSDPDPQERLDAVRKLGNAGGAARAAASSLLPMLGNPDQPLAVQQAVAQALAKLGVGSDRLLSLLQDSAADPAIRRSVAEALGEMKAGKAELLELLYSDRTPFTVRQGAARAIRLIGASSGEAIPMLLAELQEGEAVPTELREALIAQIKSIPVWKEPLVEDLTLDLVAVPGGTFLMGSPLDEAGRDWYPQIYPDTEGLDVEAQHEVAVQSFWMSQYPVTQAQWRAIALLPKVERELDPDPANFRGDHRPVETVSWYDAMEFCARLSQHTGKTYRLPSEAEWEYACRAGTTTPFHFGETLDAAIANYDGRYTYGEGSPGDFRNQTVEVGSFGVVNAFGLAEMHGTLWEWCLDHWHPSYEGAPTDGSAWVTDGDSRYRLLRGGSWYDFPGYCRSAIRNRNSPGNLNDDIGFRVVCVSPWT